MHRAGHEQSCSAKRIGRPPSSEGPPPFPPAFKSGVCRRWCSQAPQIPPNPTPPCHEPRRCQLIAGKPALRKGCGYSDYVWVAKDELPDYIKHAPTLELLQKML